MKTCQIFSIVSLLFLSSVSLAQPEIELAEAVWDLGNISKGEVIEKIFIIKNTGSDKLVIKKVRTSCECISLYILKNEAEKNSFAEIKAVFDTTKIAGNKFTKYIYIQSNDPTNPVVRIYVKGVLENKSSVQVDNKYSGVDKAGIVTVNARVYIYKAITCESLGLKEEALRCYERFIEYASGDDTPFVEKAKQRIKLLQVQSQII